MLQTSPLLKDEEFFCDFLINILSYDLILKGSGEAYQDIFDYYFDRIKTLQPKTKTLLLFLTVKDLNYAENIVEKIDGNDIRDIFPHLAVDDKAELIFFNENPEITDLESIKTNSTVTFHVNKFFKLFEMIENSEFLYEKIFEFDFSINALNIQNLFFYKYKYFEKNIHKTEDKDFFDFLFKNFKRNNYYVYDENSFISKKIKSLNVEVESRPHTDTLYFLFYNYYNPNVLDKQILFKTLDYFFLLYENKRKDIITLSNTTKKFFELLNKNNLSLLNDYFNERNSSIKRFYLMPYFKRDNINDILSFFESKNILIEKSVELKETNVSKKVLIDFLSVDCVFSVSSISETVRNIGFNPIPMHMLHWINYKYGSVFRIEPTMKSKVEAFTTAEFIYWYFNNSDDNGVLSIDAYEYLELSLSK